MNRLILVRESAPSAAPAIIATGAVFNWNGELIDLSVCTHLE